MASADPPRQLPTAPDVLLAAVAEEWPEDTIVRVRDAYDLAVEAHSPQRRTSGEPYANHVIAVAEIVAKLGMDPDTVVAALLHDVLEDTDYPAEKIKERFGSDVLGMIEGVTKLKLTVSPELDERQRAVAETTRAAESLRKLLLAMAQDFRVMVIKLADRLHNMRTIDCLAGPKQTRIATETLDVYAPIAARLGIWQVKWELEDLAFKVLHPDEFARVKELVAKSRNQREKELETVMQTLRDKLAEKGLANVEVNGRPKHLYSIFNKHVKQGIPFEEIYDLLAVRVITEENYQCYLALGLIYEIWPPIPGLYSDHIQQPKPNGYQSLHTKVFGPGGQPLEVQIRTRQMHEVAEFGVAAHWTYKEDGENAKSPDAGKQFATLRKQLFDWSKDNSTSSDFLRSVSTDLFSAQVFAFTPKGDVIDLPAKATVIDFAFRVHTKIGEKLVGATVNGVIVPLGTEIQNGDVVELQTRSNAEPSLDWLKMVGSSHTRSKIRTYLRRKNRSDTIVQGKSALEREVRSAGIDPRTGLSEDVMKQVVTQLRDCESANDVYARVGEGLVSVDSVVNRIRDLLRKDQPEAVAPEPKSKKKEPTVITGAIDNVMMRRGRCCQPVPGEDTMGYVTRGRGIMIHRRLCPNMQRLLSDDSERTLPIKWEPDGTAYPVDLKIIMIDRQGLLMDITIIIGEAKANVTGAKVRTLPNQTAEIEISIAVRDREQLRDLMNKIGNYSDVLSVLRMFGPGAKK